jgi:hypothetical protein
MAFFMEQQSIISDGLMKTFKFLHSFSQCQSMLIDGHDELCFIVVMMIDEQLKVYFTATDLKLI